MPLHVWGWVRSRHGLRTFLVATLLSCFPEGKPPNVTPQRTLSVENQTQRGRVVGPFDIAFAGPSGEVDAPREVTVLFSRPVVALELAEKEPNLPITVTANGSSVLGTWQWLGTSALVFRPERAFPSASEMRVVIPDSIKALDGSKLPKSHTIAFATPRPAITQTIAGEDDAHLAPTSTFFVSFNQAMDSAEVARGLSLTVTPAGGNAERFAITATRKLPDSSNEFVLKPVRPLPLDSEVQLVVAPSLRGLEGPRTAGTQRPPRSFDTYGPLEPTLDPCGNDTPLCRPRSQVTLGFSNEVDLRDAQRFVRIEPAIRINWPKPNAHPDWGRTLWVPGELGPATKYRITVLAGMSDRFGQKLTRNVTFYVQTGDFDPHVEVGLHGTSIELGGRIRKIPVSSINVDGYDVIATKVDATRAMEVMCALHQQRFDSIIESFDPLATMHHVSVNAARNTRHVHQLDLKKILGGDTGLLAIGNTGPTRHLAVTARTNLGIGTKMSRFGGLVWVTRLSDAHSVAGAHVEIQRCGKGVVFGGETREDGTLQIAKEAYEPQRDEASLDHVFVSKDGDIAFTGVSDQTYAAGWVDAEAAQHVQGVLFTDRGVYRPGERVEVKGIVRQPNPTGTTTPTGNAVKVHAEDGAGNTVGEQSSTLSKFGTFNVSFVLPKTTALGGLHLQAETTGTDGKATFYAYAELAAYRAAEFALDVVPFLREYVRGDRADVRVDGKYLFGSPLAGASLTIRAHRSRWYYTPKTPDGFVTTDDDYWGDLPNRDPTSMVLQTSTAALDAKGSYSGSLQLALERQRGAESIVYDVEAEDVTRQTVSSSGTFVVHPAEFYVGIHRGQELFIGQGQEIPVRVAAVSPKGDFVPSAKIRVELIHREWNSVAATAPEGDTHYESRPTDTVIGECHVTTGVDPALCRLEAKATGYMIARAFAKDRRGNPVTASTYLYVTADTSRSASAWRMGDRGELGLVADKKEYRVGDTAKILVKNPFDEAEALITVERAGVYLTERRTLKGPTPIVTISVTEAYRPNAFVGVHLIRGRSKNPQEKSADAFGPVFRYGSIDIPIESGSRELKVDVLPAQSNYRPGDTAEASVLVRDSRGKHVTSEVTFYAVDEGVLMLTGYKPPDPVATFSQARNLNVWTYDSRMALARAFTLRLDNSSTNKGDEGGGGGVRSDLRATAYFAPNLQTDASGKATVRFKLPDNLTTFRLMAVAVGTDDHFGRGEGRIVTNKDLMIRPLMPRFMRVGDSFEGGVAMNVKGKGSSDVEVSVEANGIVAEGDRTKRARVNADGAVEVRWAMRADRPTRASITFRAKGADRSDAITIHREVMVPGELEAVALAGDSEVPVAEQLGDLSRVRTDVGGLDVRVASSALVGVSDGMDQLLQYPYGCAEQLASRLLPLATLRALAVTFDVKLPKDPDALAEEAIAKILLTQRPDGGFAFWADSPRANPYLSAYVLLVLDQAKKLGLYVPPRSLVAAADYLRAQTKTPGHSVETPFVADVLATSGAPDVGLITQLYGKRATFSLVERAHLAHAWASARMDPKQGKELLRDLENAIHLHSTSAVVELEGANWYTTRITATAHVLRALIALEPTHPLIPKIVRGILGARKNGAWDSTHEAAWSLLALSDYQRALESKPVHLSVNAFFGQDSLFSASFEGHSLQAKNESIAMKNLAGKGRVLSFDVKGSGTLFYEARLRYILRDLATKPLEHGLALQKFVRGVRSEDLVSLGFALPKTTTSTVQASNLVVVDLVMSVPAPTEHVVIDDPIPAGLEPIDTRMRTVSAAIGEMDRPEGAPCSRDDACDERESFSMQWHRREVRDDRVLFFLESAEVGLYRYRYLARATTLGTFVVPPATASAMYEPDIFGRTGAGSFQVVQK